MAGPLAAWEQESANQSPANGKQADGFTKKQHSGKEDNQSLYRIAWGAPVHGLKAGISFRFGEKPVWRTEAAATFEIYLQNESDKKIVLSLRETFLQKSPPTVKDQHGQVQETDGGGVEGLGREQWRTYTLTPHECIRLDSAWFVIHGPEWEADEDSVAPTLKAAPGRYRVHCEKIRLRRGGDPNDEIALATGQLEFEIKPEAKP
jgi:hypothetical protein